MNSKLDEARTLFFAGIEHFEARRLEQARAAFEASLAAAPGRASVIGNLGITLFHLGRLADAIPLLTEATTADPLHAEAWACLALAHDALGQTPQAVGALEKVLQLNARQPVLWVKLGECRLRLGQAEQAMQAYDHALAVAPQFADAWSARGSLLRELHRLQEAAYCFEQALTYGGDAELNGYYLASVKGTDVPAPPRRYVESLFDGYAAEFQSHVIGQLGYQGHERLLQPLIASKRRFQHALDLGCGTGLCAPLIHPIADVLDGVDISRAMLEQAGRLGLYRELSHADIGAFLADFNNQADLVVAADVFIYVGELADVFGSVRRILAPGGCFAFTVEMSSGGEDLQLLPSLRYAHSEAYIRRLAASCGFTVDQIFQAPVRFDQSYPVQGMYVYLS